MMKNYLRLSIFITFLSVFFIYGNVSAVNKLTKPVSSEQFAINQTLNSLTASEFIHLRTKDIEKISGQKLSLRNKIILKLTKRNVKKKFKKSNDIDLRSEYLMVEKNFNLGGFLLGFFLGPIGVLIALLFGRNAFRSSLTGFAVSFLIGLLYWISGK